MPGATLTVVLVTRDPAVKLVGAGLQAEGIASRVVTSLPELQRALAGLKSQAVVAVLDQEIGGHGSFQIAQALEHLRTLPLLVLLGSDAGSDVVQDAQRTVIQESARKPIAASVLALRVKALVLSAGLELPTPLSPAPAQGPLEIHPHDPRGALTVVFSVKGGAGKSTIAVNLAAGLASMYRSRT
ncbi:MAG: hypothetical protein M3336_04125, partial [Chloroflexota bacterium]|nr:hypothetical protein [Chloroflexota bacterium]